jgi:WD40 repeat protein
MNSLSFDPDSNLLASTGKDACRVWRLTGESVAAFSNSHARISTSVFALGPRGDSVLVTGDEDGELVTCDITTEAKLQTLDGHTAMIRWIVAPQQGSGDVLVSADITGTIVAWIYVQGAWKVNWKLSEAHAFSVSAMRIKDKLLLTGGADGKIRIRHLDTGALLRELEEIYDAVYDVEFQDFAEKEIVAVASRNGRTVADVSFCFVLD